MGEIEAKVAAHYTPGDLHGPILAELKAAGRDVDALRPEIGSQSSRCTSGDGRRPSM